MTTITSFRSHVAGVEKELFYVLEKKNGGLTLIPRRGAYNLYREDAISPTNNPYKESRISIHPSEDDPGGNLFHRTLITRDIRRDTYIWTDAVKKKTGFTPVFFTICSDMNVRGYEPKRQSRIINVGNFDPNIFSLCYSILIGAPERYFSYPQTSQVQFIYSKAGLEVSYRFGEPLDFFTVDAVFNRFRLTLLVSYLGVPNRTGPHFFHHDTQDPTDPSIDPAELAYHQVALKGRDEHLCIVDFDFARQKLLQKFVEALPSEEDKKHGPILKFFAHPTRNSVAGRDYGRRLNLIYPQSVL